MSANKDAADVGGSTDITEDTIPHTSTISGGSSDGEGGERTAREKLKKTSIAGLARFSNTSDDIPEDHKIDERNSNGTSSNQPGEQGTRGRPSKKRSFEDLQKDESNVSTENGNIGPPLPKSGHHKRMRSRDISNTDGVQPYGKLEDVASPVQEESDAEAQQSPGGPGILVQPPTQDDISQNAEIQHTNSEGMQEAQVADTVDKKANTSTSFLNTNRSAESSSTTTTDPFKSTSSISGGFANTSTASPFGNVKGTSQKPIIHAPPATTSNSAFASSGLSAFASSEKSPFSSAGISGQSSGGFGGGSTIGGGFGSNTGGFGAASPFATKSSSGFGNASGFGSTGGFGGGFGSRPLGGGLSTFGGPPTSSNTFGKAKPLGESHDDEDDGSNDGEEGEDTHPSLEDSKQDSRFVVQDVETGEENEKTIFACRAKLYHFEREWKERGVGTFKINVHYKRKSLGSSRKQNDVEDEEEDENDNDIESGTTDDDFTTTERRARLLMRTDGVHRVVLNTPVFKDMNVGTHDGQEPNGRTMHLTGLENGKPVGFQLKIGKEEVLKDLYYKIQELKEELD